MLGEIGSTVMEPSFGPTDWTQNSLKSVSDGLPRLLCPWAYRHRSALRPVGYAELPVQP